MVYRGPDGKFRSDDDRQGRCDRHTAFTGYLSSTIPAADLSGGENVDLVDGEESVIIDFGDELDNDEVFVPELLYITAGLHGPTTASAESSLSLGYMLSTDLQNVRPANAWRGTFYGAGETTSQGIVDVAQNDSSDDSVLFAGGMFGSPSHSDSTNGLAAGNDAGHETTRLPLATETGHSVSLDADDELSVPHQIASDNVSDHAVQASFAVHVFGAVYDISDC